MQLHASWRYCLEKVISNLELRILYLNESGPYDALSYTWGNQSHIRTIRVNGSPIQITTNPYGALQSIRCGGGITRV